MHAGEGSKGWVGLTGDLKGPEQAHWALENVEKADMREEDICFFHDRTSSFMDFNACEDQESNLTPHYFYLWATGGKG